MPPIVLIMDMKLRVGLTANILWNCLVSNVLQTMDNCRHNSEWYKDLCVLAHWLYNSLLPRWDPEKHYLFTSPNETLQLIRIHARYKTKSSRTRAAMVGDMILYLIPGFVIFLILPSFAFMHFESWSYAESFYYAFVTLSTIGFGDIVAGNEIFYYE